MEKPGNPYGTHRVLEPIGVLPQPAKRLNNNFSTIYDNEILCDVEVLNVDSASFADLKKRANYKEEELIKLIHQIVSDQGKLKNPWTGSGGMFIGKVKHIGSKLVASWKQYPEKYNADLTLHVGDSIASLVSLSMTPLYLEEIVSVHLSKDQVKVKGTAVLFERSLWVKLPEDIPQTLALAVLDVAGAPAQVQRLAEPGQTVAVIGARGKSGLLSCYSAKKKIGINGKLIAITPDNTGIEDLKNAPFIDEIVIAKADDALDLFEKIKSLTNESLCDLVVNCVNVENCEMGTILITKDRGKAYFFSMATQFTKATLGAEGVGKDIDMLMGNGYCENHAEIALNILRESPYIRALYQTRYV